MTLSLISLASIKPRNKTKTKVFLQKEFKKRSSDIPSKELPLRWWQRAFLCKKPIRFHNKWASNLIPNLSPNNPKSWFCKTWSSLPKSSPFLHLPRLIFLKTKKRICFKKKYKLPKAMSLLAILIVKMVLSRSDPIILPAHILISLI